MDPAYKVVKRCFIGPDPQAYTWAGDEGSAFSVPSNVPVAYGANGHFVFKVLSGTIACNNTTFGDPANGAPKSCYRLKETHLAASEGQTFSPAPLQTIYGSGLNGNMYYSAPAPRDCSSTEFGGDPDYGFVKYCWTN